MPSLEEAAASGSQVEALRVLRDRLARDIDECQSMRDLAALSQRLMDVLKQLDELDPSARPAPEQTGHSRFMEKLNARRSS